MKVIVCGGRNFNEQEAVNRALNLAHEKQPFSLLIEGGQSGADRAARNWAKSAGVEVATVEADWETHGRAAGPIRNRKMVADHHPASLIAFPGGIGTADMVRVATAAGMHVWKPFKGVE